VVPKYYKNGNVIQKVISGRTYWYLGENRRIDGKTKRVWQKYLGTADKLKQTLEEGFKPQNIETMEFGLVASLLCLEEELKFVKIINKIIPKRNQGLTTGEHMFINILNRLDQPTSKNKLGEWFNETFLKRRYLVKSTYLSSQGFWNHWGNFDDRKIHAIQERILEKLVKKVSINDLFYDPTNFTTYIEEHKQNKIPKFGHAKSKIPGLRQVNLALLLTRKDAIPLWHHTYEGNKNEAKEFKEFMRIIFKRIVYFHRKCKQIILILDKGNNSKKNFRLLNERIGFFVLGSLKPSMFPELLQIPLSKFNRTYIDDKGEKTKYYTCVRNVYEGRKRIVITYNQDLAYCQRLSTNRAINKALQELYGLQRKLNKDKWAIRDNVFLKVNKILGKPYLNNLLRYELRGEDKKLSLNFDIDEEAYERKANTFGKNILFTDNLTLSPEEIIKGYRNKDVIEHQFKALKNPHIIRFTPVWCWTDKMIKMHAFTCVLALLFLRILIKKIKDADIQLSQNEALEQLKKIKLALLKMPNSEKVHTKITRLNNEQKELAKLFKLKNYC